MTRGRSRAEVLRDYEETWDEHRGNLHAAAARLGMTKTALERALYRARKDGVQVRISGVKY